MLLAGGQGSRLGVLTRNSAKPAISFGGKYKIIDFPLSNCINSGIDTVGVLTQYQPLSLNTHIGIGIAWDLDKNYGGVRILPPYEREEGSEWYTGTANAIYQNIAYIDTYDPEYVLILSGDHIYKMDYGHMLEFHKRKNADVTIASMSVSWEEAHRFGILITQEDDRIVEFEEKPKEPRSNVASMGIYIFKWRQLKEAMLALKDTKNLDFGKHVIPYMHHHHAKIYSYGFHGYWKDVGTLDSYWQANMELIELLPEFNLYQEFWKIYTNSDTLQPQYIADGAILQRSIISESCEIYGHVENSVLGTHVKVGRGSFIRDSIIMKDCVIGENCVIEKAIIADNTVIGDGVTIGQMPEAENELLPKIYTGGLSTIGEHTVIPDGVRIGKNTAIMGHTTYDDYVHDELPSGGVLIKEEQL